MEKKAILIPSFMKEETPIAAGFCEIVNAALKENPNMSLAEFAQGLNEVNKERALERLQKAIEKQFKGG